MSERRDARWPVVVGVVVGAGFATVGVLSLLGEADDTNPAVTARWLVGLTLAHDLVLVPAVLAVGAAVRRWVPGRLRPYVAGGLVVSAVVALVAWPAVRGYGRQAGNPSLLPRDYADGLAVVVGLVWVVVAALTLRRRRA